VVLIIQIGLLIVADEETVLPLLSPVCLIVLPALAWMGGFLTIGAAFRKDGPKVKRSPRLGVAICLVPNALLCAGLGVLFFLR